MRSCAAEGVDFDDIKSGDTWLGQIGFPSVGKNTLLNAWLTHFQKSKKENSPPLYIPRVIRYRGSKLQLLYLPGIIEGAKDGKVKGRHATGIARTFNFILILTYKGLFPDNIIITLL